MLEVELRDVTGRLLRTNPETGLVTGCGEGGCDARQVVRVLATTGVM